MTKEELSLLLSELNISVSEGITSDLNTHTYPRVDYWEFGWDSQTSSGAEYNTIVSYQVSFYAEYPRHEKLVLLKQKLNEKGLFPFISHEYVMEDKCWHSYFAVEVLEDVE